MLKKTKRDGLLTEVITAPEAEQLWGLRPGTVRRACRESRIAARRSAGTWLTTRAAMIKKYGNPPPNNAIKAELQTAQPA